MLNNVVLKMHLCYGPKLTYCVSLCCWVLAM